MLGADSSEDAKESTEVLNRAAGFLRSQLSRESKMRSVPQLRFYFDSSVGQGRLMEDLIGRAAKADLQLSGDVEPDVGSEPSGESE